MLKINCSIPHLILKNENFQYLVEELPTNQILVETDSPYLHNEREFPNTPLSIIDIYKKIAEIKKLDKKEIENIIYNNYQKIFFL
jgi:TatD DNase family protein